MRKLLAVVLIITSLAVSARAQKSNPSFGLGGHVYANPAPGPGEDFFVSFLFGLNVRL